MKKKAKIERLEVCAIETAIDRTKPGPPPERETREQTRLRLLIKGEASDDDVDAVVDAEIKRRHEWDKEWCQELRERRKRLVALRRESQKNPVHLNSVQLEDLLDSEKVENCKRLRRDVYLFRNILYSVEGPYSEPEFKILIREEADRESAYFQRACGRHQECASEPLPLRRERIPERVRVAVWRRDQGRCARCGRREKLEYDHIIPVAEGGGSTARNIELLCERCNRSKGRKIT